MASWPLQFISLCWLSFAGFFFTVYESMEKSRKSLPRISTLRSCMSSSDGVSWQTHCLRCFGSAVFRENENTRVSLFLAMKCKDYSFSFSVCFAKEFTIFTFSSEIAFHYTPFIAYYHSTVDMHFIYLCLLYKWITFCLHNTMYVQEHFLKHSPVRAGLSIESHFTKCGHVICILF